VTEKNFPAGRYEPRTYANGITYTPVAPEDRKIGINKPDDPDAVRFHGRWFLPLQLLKDGQRVMPVTRADTDAYDHMERSLLCRCQVCSRPEAERWRRKWRREQGMRPAADRRPRA
jgi:hypothetical protein